MSAQDSFVPTPGFLRPPSLSERKRRWATPRIILPSISCNLSSKTIVGHPSERHSATASTVQGIS